MRVRSNGRHARPSEAAPLFKQSFLLTISTAIAAGGGFLAWSLAAHETTARAVGVAAGLFASCSFLSYLTSLALPYGLLRYGRGPGGVRILYHSVLLTAGTSIVGAAAFALGSSWWSPALVSQLHSPLAMILYIVLNISVGVTIVLDSYFIAQGQAGVTCFRAAIVAIGKVGGVLLFGAFHYLYSAQLYCCMLVPGIISIALVSPKIFRGSDHLTRRESAALRRAFIRFSLKTYPGALLDGAPVFVLPVLALRLVGPTQNAYFYVAWSITGVVGLLAGVIGQVALRESSSSKDRRALARRAQILAVSATALAVVILGSGAELVLEIFGPHYANATMPLRLLLLSTLPASYLTIAIALLRGRKRYNAVNQASVAYAALSIGATLVSGAIYGLPGVCSGWLLGVTLSAVATFAIVIRQPSNRGSVDTESWLLAGEADDRKAA